MPEMIGTLVTAPFKDKAEFLHRQRYAPEWCPFRTEHVYNNLMFAMAGEFAAQIAGISLENLLDELFLDLEMSATTYIKEGVDYENLTNMSKAYYRNNTQSMKYNMELLKRVTIAPGSGGILSNANDMLKYLKFHLNKGKVGNRQVVSEEAMSWLSKSAIQVPFDGWKTNVENSARGNFGYGLGLSIGTYDGWERVSHGGYIPPFLSQLTLFPALNIGIFTTSNGPGALPQGSEMNLLHAQIFDILNGKSNNSLVNRENPISLMAHSPKVTSSESNAKPIINALIENLSAQIVGLWGHGLSGEFTITTLPETETTGEYLFNYGNWGLGILRPNPNRNSTFTVDWINDVVQDEFTYAASGGSPPVVLDFNEANKVAMSAFGGTLVFEKDLTLDKLPLQPWDPNSCGPKLD
jgi:hypothetical protein